MVVVTFVGFVVGYLHVEVRVVLVAGSFGVVAVVVGAAAP